MIAPRRSLQSRHRHQRRRPRISNRSVVDPEAPFIAEVEGAFH
jgi:hypothetical protein